MKLNGIYGYDTRSIWNSLLRQRRMCEQRAGVTPGALVAQCIYDESTGVDTVQITPLRVSECDMQGLIGPMASCSPVLLQQGISGMLVLAQNPRSGVLVNGDGCGDSDGIVVMTMVLVVDPRSSSR